MMFYGYFTRQCLPIVKLWGTFQHSLASGNLGLPESDVIADLRRFWPLIQLIKDMGVSIVPQKWTVDFMENPI